MRTPSRWIPAYRRPRLGVSAICLLLLFIIGFAYVIYSISTALRCSVGIFIAVVWLASAASNRRTRQRLEALAQSRPNESIGEFARSFDTRLVDTWVIRATHQELQAELHAHVHDFPLRASDLLEQDLQIDWEDLEMSVLPTIAERAGRSLFDSEQNPYYGKVLTVEHLVLFINAQPRIEAQPKQLKVC